MAKTKKAGTKSTKSTTSKKAVKPLEAPRIKLPEDDLPPVKPPTISGMLSEKLRKAGSFLGRHKFKVLVVGLILVVGAWILNNYLETRNQLNQLANPKTSTQTEISIITDQIRSTVELPANETPTIATVSDVEKLKGQNFFKNAENGDKVLIYSQAGKALLYRYNTKKVIEYSNVNLGGNANNNQNEQQNNSQQQAGAQQTNQQTSTPQNTQTQQANPQTPQGN